jgi:hypothetical protein
VRCPEKCDDAADGASCACSCPAAVRTERGTGRPLDAYETLTQAGVWDFGARTELARMLGTYGLSNETLLDLLCEVCFANDGA